MSLGARATKAGGGAKSAGTKHGHQEAKGKAADKPAAKDKIKPQATTEQLRMANMIDRKNEDTLDVRRMVLELMEMTCRTEEEVCSALHDSDNDMTLACELLLEESQRIQGEWQTNEKKKKKGGGGAGNGDAGPPAALDPRSRSGPRQRRDGGGGEGGARGRGAGRGRGAPRGGRAGGRGTGRPRLGPRRPHQEQWPEGGDDNNHYGSSGGAFPPAEDWDTDDKYVPNAGSFPPAEDWDNEEWSGSLADTKVFTPSVTAQPLADPEPLQLNNSMTENWDLEDSPSNNGPTTDPGHLNYTYHNSSHQINKSAESVGGRKPLEAVPSPVSTADLTHPAVQPQQPQPIGLSGSLSAAQSQYLSQLTQQSQQHDNSVYTSNYGVYGSAEMASQRKPQRARVPPPSKIPSSAVEMPGEPNPMGFIDVQFGALEPETLAETQPVLHPATPKQQVPLQAEPSPPTHPAHDTIPEANSYSSAASMLSESLSVVETTPSSQAVTVDANSANASLESRLTASMKQLSTEGTGAGAEPTAATPATQAYAAGYHQQQYVAPHRSTKHQTVGQQSVYAAHHAVSHLPVYGASVYAPVNSSGASLTAASAMSSPYPPSVTLSQYGAQPLNSYQTSSSASVYGGSALYTAAPYTAYQPAAAKPSAGKEPGQYEPSAASQRPLAGAATTQAQAPKVTAAPAKVTSGSNVNAAQYAVQAQPQPQAFYTQQQGQVGAAAYAAYTVEEAQMMRGTLPHHMVNNGGYYEVNYGVGGVANAREPAAGFGLAGERFGRADAASPQQVTAPLPPGYAYFFQPPPATYQYGVYPQYGGGGTSVGGVTGVGGVTAASKVGYGQQPQYDAQPQQDTYKQGAYSAAGKAGGAAQSGAELTSAMYAKAHATLNKVNSYEKAAFHSGTPPPFGGGGAAPHHLYIPAAPQPHHNPHHHHQAPQHQMDIRVNSNHRRESTGGAARGAGAGKPAANKPYSQSYWAPN